MPLGPALSPRPPTFNISTQHVIRGARTWIPYTFLPGNNLSAIFTLKDDFPAQGRPSFPPWSYPSERLCYIIHHPCSNQCLHHYYSTFFSFIYRSQTASQPLLDSSLHRVVLFTMSLIFPHEHNPASTLLNRPSSTWPHIPNGVNSTPDFLTREDLHALHAEGQTSHVRFTWRWS